MAEVMSALLRAYMTWLGTAPGEFIRFTASFIYMVLYVYYMLAISYHCL